MASQAPPLSSSGTVPAANSSSGNVPAASSGSSGSSGGDTANRRGKKRGRAPEEREPEDAPPQKSVKLGTLAAALRRVWTWFLGGR